MHCKKKLEKERRKEREKKKEGKREKKKKERKKERKGSRKEGRKNEEKKKKRLTIDASVPQKKMRREAVTTPDPSSCQSSENWNLPGFKTENSENSFKIR